MDFKKIKITWTVYITYVSMYLIEDALLLLHTTLLREQSKQDGKNNVIQVSSHPLETEVIVSAKFHAILKAILKSKGQC